MTPGRTLTLSEPLSLKWQIVVMGQVLCKLIFFLKFNFYLFIYLFIYLSMAVLGLRFCVRAFSSCGKWGPLFIAASLVAEHRLQTRRLSNCGSRA